MRTKLAKEKRNEDTGHGYWMYEDGVSCWGVGTYRGCEKPLKINVLDDDEDVKAAGSKEEKAEVKARKTKQIHENKNIQEKAEWHKAEVTRLTKEEQVRKEKDDAKTKK